MNFSGNDIYNLSTPTFYGQFEIGSPQNDIGFDQPYSLNSNQIQPFLSIPSSYPSISTPQPQYLFYDRYIPISRPLPEGWNTPQSYEQFNEPTGIEVFRYDPLGIIITKENKNEYNLFRNKQYIISLSRNQNMFYDENVGYEIFQNANGIFTFVDFGFGERLSQTLTFI